MVKSSPDQKKKFDSLEALAEVLRATAALLPGDWLKDEGSSLTEWQEDIRAGWPQFCLPIGTAQRCHALEVARFMMEICGESWAVLPWNATRGCLAESRGVTPEKFGQLLVSLSSWRSVSSWKTKIFRLRNVCSFFPTLFTNDSQIKFSGLLELVPNSKHTHTHTKKKTQKNKDHGSSHGNCGNFHHSTVERGRRCTILQIPESRSTVEDTGKHPRNCL